MLPCNQTFKSRTSAIKSHLPASRLLGLLVFSVLTTWLLSYQKMLSFFVSEGIDPAEIGYQNIALEMFDTTTVLFGFLVFLAAGVGPLIMLFIRADANRSKTAQIIWLATIVGLIVLARLAS
ncbi:MAG: hypothetical protein WBM40_10700 [Thiohalocapsa sp.]